MADTSERITIGRAELVIGFSLLAIGLFISVGAWNTIHSYQGGVREKFNVTPAPGYPFWMPLEWEVLKVPDYLLQYLVVGVFITSVGITILASTVWKRLIDTNLDNRLES